MSKRKSNAQGGSAAKPEAGTGPKQEAPEGAENVVAAGGQVSGEPADAGTGGDAGAPADDGAATVGAESVNDEEALAQSPAASDADQAEHSPEEPSGRVPDQQEQPADDDQTVDRSEAISGSPGPNPDSIATTAMLAAGAAYFRATRLGEEVADGIDFGWLIDDRKDEIVDRRASAEKAVIALADFCRKVPAATASTLVMHLKLAGFRASAETTDEEFVAFNVFAGTLQQLDGFAEAKAAEARQKHKKIARPAAIDIEETTLALVDEPMALTEIGMRQAR